MKKLMNYVYNGSRAFSGQRPLCSAADTELPRGIVRDESYCMPWEGSSNQGAITLRGTPVGPQVEPKF